MPKALTTTATIGSAATIRSAVNACALGSSSAMRPISHALYANIANVVDVARLQDPVASSSAHPTEAGRQNHSARVTQSNETTVVRRNEVCVRILRSLMTRALLHGGIATAIGSLPHPDAPDAAALMLRTMPDLPAAPSLPCRSPHEGMLAQWLRALPEVAVGADGALSLRPGTFDASAVDVAFDECAHGGLLEFIELAVAQSTAPKAIKLQLSGPLTLALALIDLGIQPDVAFARASRCASAWAQALVELVKGRLPDTEVVMFFDEPGLVHWASDHPVIDVESASDYLSAALAAPECVVGVHVCGAGALDVALAAGPDVIGIDVHERWLDHAVGLARFLDGGGFIAWGAVPTDRPIGELAAPLWKELVALWCDLTQRGCDPVLLRRQAMVTPACGLALHGPSQAERALRLTRELADRVFDQALGTRLSIGA